MNSGACCEVEQVDEKSVRLYVDNVSCGGSFYVAFSKRDDRARLVWIEGKVIDLQRFRDARRMANELLKTS